MARTTTRSTAKAPRSGPVRRPRPAEEWASGVPRDLLGQARAKADLQALLHADRLPPALIFHGPAGVGKMTAARILAALLLDPETTGAEIDAFEPRRGSETAHLLEVGSHPDLHWIAKSRCRDSQVPALRERKLTNIPVDLLRELMLGGIAGEIRFESTVQRTPYRGHGKVFLIDEAEDLDATGQNALLKTLEEPPSRTWIVLVVTDRTRLLPTIRSRCHQVAFTPLDEPCMERFLGRLGDEIDPADRAWLLDFAEGSPGRVRLALDASLRAWEQSLDAPLAALAARGAIDGFSTAMADLVKGFAEAQVKADPQASKEAANRLGTRLLLGMLARRLRTWLRDAASTGDAAAAARWASWIERLDLAERHLDANVNLVHALADLVAAWASIGPDAA